MKMPRIDRDFAVHAGCLAVSLLMHIAADHGTHLICDLVPALVASVLVELQISGLTGIVVSFFVDLVAQLQIAFSWSLLAALATELPLELGLLLGSARKRSADELCVAQKGSHACSSAPEQRSLTHLIGS